ncbi:hypothetical protein [Heyndrickxia coagulans]|uniref:hypothetical protein n=1 Tax=Heyndrickxia coagulans TaxID=1398 RepID=UPI0034D777D9
MFPLYLKDLAQSWFATLDPSRRRTWEDLAREFIRQFSFNTLINVTRRELEALRQGRTETATAFISRWREKMLHMMDRPSEADQIRMLRRALQPHYSGPVASSPATTLEAFLTSLYGVEEAIAAGVLPGPPPLDTSTPDSRVRRGQSSHKQVEVGVVESSGLTPSTDKYSSSPTGYQGHSRIQYRARGQTSY